VLSQYSVQARNTKITEVLRLRRNPTDSGKAVRRTGERRSGRKHHLARSARLPGRGDFFAAAWTRQTKHKGYPAF